MTIWAALLLLCIGVVAGALGSLAGLGGGVIIVPSLLLFGEMGPALSGMTPQMAVGTSLVVIIFTAISSTISYMKRQRVDFSSGLLFFLGSGPGSVIGAWLTGIVSSDRFALFLGLLLLFLAFILSIKDRIKPRKVKWQVEKTYTEPVVRTSHDAASLAQEQVTYGYNRWIALSISFAVGLLAGFFGIGGGALLVPMMVIFFFFPAQVATATSMFTILLTSIMGSVTHIAMGNVDWLYAILLIPGAWIGGWLGAWVAARISGNAITWVARITIAVVGLDMIAEGLF